MPLTRGTFCCNYCVGQVRSSHQANIELSINYVTSIKTPHNHEMSTLLGRRSGFSVCSIKLQPRIKEWDYSEILTLNYPRSPIRCRRRQCHVARPDLVLCYYACINVGYWMVAEIVSVGIYLVEGAVKRSGKQAVDDEVGVEHHVISRKAWWSAFFSMGSPCFKSKILAKMSRDTPCSSWCLARNYEVLPLP